MSYDALIVDHGGVLTGPEHVLDLLRAARAVGLRTALLSNAETGEHLAGDWQAHVDVAVRSGDVGLRKPQVEVYALVAARLGVAAERCVFVDDLPANVRGAAAAGMTGVLHVTHDRTREELEALLGVPLRDAV